MINLVQNARIAAARMPVGLVLTLPAAAFLAAFMIYPVCSLLLLSLYDYSPLRSAALIWVGWGNYVEALFDPASWASLRTTIVFTLGSVAIELAVGLLLAVLLARVTIRNTGRLGLLAGRIFSAGFILPFAIPSVTAAVIWKIMLDPQIGPVDALLGAAIPWFAHYPLMTIIVIDAWKTTPFVMFLLFAAIMSIEPSQYEAAELDGADGWQQFRHLTFPAILPVLTVTAALRAVDAFTKAFDIILATTGGGPGQASMVFPLFIWRTAFVSLHFGEASALAVIAIVISGAVGVGVVSIRSRATR
jgi:multiple sugar transport system permease protein